MGEKSVEKAFGKIDSSSNMFSDNLGSTENRLQAMIDEKFKEASEKLEGAERFQSNNAQEARQRLNAVDLRISGLQGACVEHKREIGKMRDEVNTLMVKGSAHDVDIGKLSDDMKRVGRTRSGTSRTWTLCTRSSTRSSTRRATSPSRT